jgi:hypothetical protein
LILFEILRPNQAQLDHCQAGFISTAIEALEQVKLGPSGGDDDEEEENEGDPVSKENGQESSPLSTPASVKKPPLHADSPTLLPRKSSSSLSGGQSFKLDGSDGDDGAASENGFINELVEVESLIGDQIERWL